MRPSARLSGLAAMAVAAAACSDLPEGPAHEGSPDFAVVAAAAIDETVARAYLSTVNAQLAAEGRSVAATKLEFSLAHHASPNGGTVIYANDRTLRLPTRWVPGDERRLAAGNTLTQGTFTPLASSTSGAGIEGPVDASFDTWNDVQCSNVDVVKRVIPPGTIPSLILGGPGFVNDAFVVDIATIGFLPGNLIDAVLGPGASQFVLGVTFTFVFIGPDGEPTDIDNDRREDTAHKEVWYNDAFFWTDSGGFGTDVETVALHENGHALELGHFGQVRVTTQKNMQKLFASPRAVMNAVILGDLRTLLGTDKSALCGNFGNWPR
jgi:hypothetical protein